MGGERNSYYYLGLYGSLGLTMVAVIVFFMSIGIYLDKHFATGTVWSLVMTITGMLLGAWMAFRRIFQSMRDLEEEPSEKPEDDLHKKQEQAGMENNNQHSE